MMLGWGVGYVNEVWGMDWCCMVKDCVLTIGI